MAPRSSYGDKPMTSAERVRRARWANRLEETAFRLLDLLKDMPEPLPRTPVIPSELLEKLNDLHTKSIGHNYPARAERVSRVLKLGNGNQSKNKQKALKFVASFLNADIVDKKTIWSERWGYCHLSAYTHPTGAMISTPSSQDNDYGEAEWHKNDHILMFRDVGDGRCVLYISKIAPLFERRTIGHHGVTWDNVEQAAEYVQVLDSRDVLDVLEQINNQDARPSNSCARDRKGLQKTWFTFYDVGINTLNGLPPQAKIISEYLIKKFADKGPISRDMVVQSLDYLAKTGKLKSKQPVMRIFAFYARKLREVGVLSEDHGEHTPE